MRVGPARRARRFAKAPRLLGPTRVGLALGILATVLIAAPAAVNAASTHAARPTKTLTPLQKGLNFYKGQTITFVSPDSPGGGYNQWAVNVQPFLAQYLHATVNIESIPAGNTIAGQDFVAHSNPNGLTVGWMNAGVDIEDEILNLPALNFNPEREAFLGATTPGYTAVLALKSAACSQFATFQDLITNGTASNQVTEALQTAGTTTFYAIMLNTAFALHYRAILGYASTALQIAGFERGDACVTVTNAATAAPLVAGGKAIALALSTPLPPADGIAPTFAGVPTLAQIYVQNKALISASKSRTAAFDTLTDVNQSTARIFFAPEATPTPERLALEAAFKWTMKNPALTNEAVTQGNPTGLETGPVALANFELFYKQAKREVPVLTTVIG